MQSLIKSFVATSIRFKSTIFLIAILALVSFIYSTHLSLILIPKGYDLLFHLGNVFAMQIKFGFVHNSLASFGISPLIFNDFGYGVHLFYPPLAHLVPAFISFLLSKIGINSTLLAIRLFSFLTIFGSGATMFYTAKKISNNAIYASFAALLYLSAPYLQMDYYWRGGMSSSLCFVFLPILLLSLYYFIKERFTPYLFTFVISMTLIVWTHALTAFYSLIFYMIALTINFILTKNKKRAFLATLISGLMIGVMTSPFWSLLAGQYALQKHVIFGDSYPFTITNVAHNTLDFHALFDIQFDVWKFKIRSLTAIFNLTNLPFFLIFILLLRKVKKTLNNSRFLHTLIGLFVVFLIATTTQSFWIHLPSYFAFIQYPHRLLLQATPVLSLLSALPFVLVDKLTRKKVIILSLLGVSIVSYTFVFNNFHLSELGKIDYTTHSIIQAMGVEREYLPSKTKGNFERVDNRAYEIMALNNNESATPSAAIVENETPYLLAKISNNDSRQTLFELPRLFYAGYELKWKAEGAEEAISLPYDHSEDGLITTTISGDGVLEVQYTGGRWYALLSLAAFTIFGYLLVLLYRYSQGKNPLWLEKD